jgi:hypothetical protein
MTFAVDLEALAQQGEPVLKIGTGRFPVEVQHGRDSTWADSLYERDPMGGGEREEKSQVPFPGSAIGIEHRDPVILNEGVNKASRSFSEYGVKDRHGSACPVRVCDPGADMS